jgi:hypothetical protein
MVLMMKITGSKWPFEAETLIVCHPLRERFFVEGPDFARLVASYGKLHGIAILKITFLIERG